MLLTDWLSALRRPRKTFRLSPRNKHHRSKTSSVAQSRLPRSVDLLEQRTMLTVAPVSDVIASALALNLNAGESTQFHAEIGDEASMDLDVDVFQVDLLDGQELTVDIDALQLDDLVTTLSSLDSYIRIFSSDGTQLNFNDNGTDPDTGLAGNDAFLSFIAPATGTYFIGVSGAANTAYNPNLSDSGVSGSTGEYYLQASVGAAPAATALRLENIQSTTDAVISGTFANDLGVYMPSIEFDLDGDGTADEYASPDGANLFSKSIDPLTVGDGLTVYVRGTDFDFMTSTSLVSPWYAVHVNYEAPVNEAPVISNLTLVNDTDMPGDNITSDARVSGVLIDDVSNMEYTIEFDFDNDGNADTSLLASNGSSFTIDAGTYLGTGPATVKVRGLEWDDYLQTTIAGDWYSLSFTYEPGSGSAAPEITSLQLTNDTDTPGDNITTDPAINGQVTYMGDMMMMSIQVDTNGDQISDANATFDPGMGTFSYTPSGLTPGVHTISVRAVDDMAMIEGQWSSLTFTLEDAMAGSAPEISSLQLTNDTDTPSDNVTTDPAINGQVTYMGDMMMISIQVDTNGDQISDTNATFDPGMGTFSYTPSGLTPGVHTISVRAVDDMAMIEGQWSSLTFTLEDAMAGSAPEISSLQLTNDTDTPGDNVTTDPAINGQVTYMGDMMMMSIQVDTNGDQISDANATFDPGMGTFSYTPTGLSPGVHTISVRAVDDMAMIEGLWSSLTFTLEDAMSSSAPEITSLQLTNDTDMPGDNITSDPTISGQVTYSGGAEFVTLDIDINGDGTIETSVSPDLGGNFTFDPSAYITAGPILISVRPVDQMMGVSGQWANISYEFEGVQAGGTPEITTFSLSNDTGTPGDLMTTDPTLSGQISYTGMMSDVAVEFDVNGDGMTDATAWPDSGGNFSYNPLSLLTPGSVTVSVRAYDQMTLAYGAWSSITFTLEEEMAGMVPEVTSLQLTNDTGMPGDNITTDPALNGQVTYMGDMMAVSVEVDTNNDQIFDAYAAFDSMLGTFTYTPSGLTPGSHTIAIRAVDPMAGVEGNWSNITFTLDETNNAPVMTDGSLAAAEDGTTVTTGVLASDADGDDDATTLTYAITTQPTEGSATSNEDGTFIFDPGTDFQDLAAGETRQVTFTVTATDSHSAISNTGTVTVTVTGVNDSPSVSATVSSTVNEDNGTFSLDLLTNASDADTNDTLTINNLLNTLGDDAGITVIGNTLDIDPSAYNHLASGESEIITYTYDIVDGNGGSVTQSATITVTGVNDGPTVSAAVSSTVTEDAGTYSLDLLTSASDVDTSDTLAISNLVNTLGDDSGITVNGTTLDIDPGAYSHLLAGESEVITYTYDVVDGNGGVVAQTASITITGANDAPVVTDGSLAAAEDGTMVATIVLASDADSDDDANSLSYTITAQPTEGTATSNGDGTFTFDPGTDFQDLAAGETRQVTFTVTATDSHSAISNPGTVTVTVTGVNDGPTVSATVSSTVTEDNGTYSLDLLTGASDVDTTDTLTISNLLNTLGDDAGITVNGTSLDIDPSAYNHLAPGESEIITYTYNVVDGNGGSVAQTASITITGVNDAPVATDDAFTTVESTVFNIGNVLNTNPTLADSDPEGDTFTVTAVAGGSIGSSFALASGALLTLNENGTFSYDPNGQFESLAVGETATDSFNYTITDLLGASSTATATITVTGLNDGPTISATISSTVTEDAGTYSLDLLTGASDVDTSDTLTINNLVNTLGDESGIMVNGTTLDIDPNAYSHLLAGESEVITYTYDVIDGNGGVVAQTASITIIGANDAPVVTDGSLAAAEDGTTVATIVLASDADSDDDANSLSYNITTQPTEGTATSNGDGTFTFDPGTDFQDLAAGETRQVTFTVTATDSHSAVSNTGTITVTVTGVNDGPTVSAAVSSTVTEDNGTYSLDLLTNASDADTNDTLTINNLLNTLGDDAGISINGNVLDIDPDAYNHLAPGESEVITYTYDVVDGNGGSVAQTASITITGVNDAPIATDDAFTTDEATVFNSGNVLNANPTLADSDPEGDTFTVTAVAGGSIGSSFALASGALLTLNEDGTFSYDPNGQFESLAVGESATDSFNYTITDLLGASGTATATITVTGINDGPTVSAAISSTVSEDAGTFNLDLLTNASDVDTSDTLTISNLVNTAGDDSGVTVNGSTLDIDPGAYSHLLAGESEVITYTYDVVDGNGGSVAQTASITITGANDAPVVADGSLAATEDGTTVATIVLASDADSDDDATTLTYTITTQTTEGTATSNGDGTFTFDPGTDFQDLAAGETRQVTFSYTATDSHSAVSNTGTVTVTVTGVNDGPTVSAAVSSTVTEDNGIFSLDLLTDASDTDTTDTLTISNLLNTLGDDAGITVNGTTLDIDPSAYNHLALGESEVITYTFDVVDGNGGSVAQTATITITGVNDAPIVSAALSSTVTEDAGAFSLDLFNNTSDVDTNDTLTISNLLKTLGDDSGITVNDNVLDVDPSAYSHLLAGESEIITYTFNIADDNGEVVSQTATITIIGVNDAPVVTDASLAATEDGTTVSTGVLASDADSDNDANSLSYSITAQPTEGSATSNGDGTFAFDPGTDFQDLTAGETRQVTFSYTATDSHSAVSNTGTVTVTITGINDDPTASNESIAATEDGSTVITSVLASDVDSDNDANSLTYTIITQPTEGTVVSNGDGTFTFDPGTDFQDLAAGETRQVTFSYTATDSHSAVSNTGTVTVTVTGIDAFLSIDDIAVNESMGMAVFTVTLSNNVASGVTVDWSTTDVTAFAGTDYVSDSGTLNFVGTAGETQTISVSLVKDLNIESAEQFLIQLSNAQATGQNVLIQDDQGVATITDNLPPQVATLELAIDTDTQGDLITSYAHIVGSLTDIDQTNSTYEIQVDYDNDGVSDLSISTADLFDIDLASYLQDGEVTVQVRVGEWDTQTGADIYGDWSSLTFTYDSPLNQGTPFISGLSLVNDTDTAGDLITSDATLAGTILDDGTNSEYILQFDLDNDGISDLSVEQGVNQAFTYDLGDELEAGTHTVQVRALGLNTEGYGYIYGVWSATTFTYAPPLEVNATLDSLALVTDSGINDDLITVSPTFTGEVTSTSDYANFTVELDFQNDGIVDSTTTLDQDGTFTVDPSASITTGANTVAVRLVDTTTGAIGDWSTLSFELITLTATTLANEFLSISQDTIANIDLLASASYRDHISLAITSSPVNGTVSTVTNEDFTRTLTYTPDANFTGTDTITYSVSDIQGNASTATLTFTIFANAAPTADNDATETYETDPVTVNILTNDSDPDGHTFSLKSVDTPLFGTLEIDPAGSDPGTIVYTANEYFVGTEHITYTIEDEHGRTSTGILTINVLDRPAPELIGLSLFHDTEFDDDLVTEDASLTGQVSSTRELEFVRIQFDYDGDNVVDGTSDINIAAASTFLYDANPDLTYGDISLSARAVEVDADGNVINTGNWNYLTFEYVEMHDPPVVLQEIDPNADLVTNFSAEIVTTAMVRLIGQAANTNGGDEPIIEFDLDQDAQVDATTTVTAGAFSQEYTTEIGYGEITILARTKDWDDVNQKFIYSEWTDLTITRDAPPNDAPLITQVGLLEDTDIDGDGITSNSTLTGTVTNSDGTVDHLLVEYDLDGDQVLDGFVYTEETGTGSFTISFDSDELLEGANTINVRVREWDVNIENYVSSDWSSVTFTYEPPVEVPFGLDQIQLVNDTETPDDKITTDPRISVIVTGDLTAFEDTAVLFDFDLDGVVDGRIDSIDPTTGEAIIDLTDYVDASGEYLIFMKAWGWDDDVTSGIVSDWVEFRFTYEAPIWGPPQVTNLELSNDTDTPDDSITSDPTLIGSVVYQTGPLDGILVEYDIDGDGLIDGSELTNDDGSGSFELDLSVHDLEFGSQTISVRASVWSLELLDFESGDWSLITFTYQDTIDALPQVTSLALVNDTGTPGDNITSDPVISGVVVDGDTDLSGLPLEFDVNGDGVAEGTAYTDITGSGEFLIDVSPYLSGETLYTVQVRAAQWNESAAEYEFGNWSSIAFTYETEAQEELEGSEDSGQVAQSPFTPAELAHATLYTSSLALPYTAQTESPENEGIYRSEYDNAGDLVIDASFLATIGVVNTDDSTPFTDTVTTTDVDGNITEVTTTTLTTTVIVGTESVDGEWYRREIITTTYTVDTNYTAIDGAGYHLVQTGTYGYTIEAYGYSGNAAYQVSEYRTDEFVNDQWTAADPATIYTTEDAQEFTTEASGYQKANQNGLIKSGSTFVDTQLTVDSLFTVAELAAPTVSDVDYTTASLETRTTASFTASGATGDGTADNGDWNRSNSISTVTDENGDTATTTTFGYSNSIITPISESINTNTTTQNSASKSTTINHISSLTGTKVDTYSTSGSRTTFDDGTYYSTVTQSTTNTINDTYTLNYTKSTSVTDNTTPGATITANSSSTNTISRNRNYTYTVTTITDRDVAGNVTVAGTIGGSNVTTYSSTNTSSSSSNGTNSQGDVTLSFTTTSSGNATENGSSTINISGTFGAGYANTSTTKTITEFTTGNTSNSNSASSSRTTSTSTGNSSSLNSSNNTYSSTINVTETNAGGVISTNGSLSSQSLGGGITNYNHTSTTNVTTPTSTSSSSAYNNRSSTFATTSSGNGSIINGVLSMTVGTSYRVPIGEGSFARGGTNSYSSNTTDNTTPGKTITSSSSGGSSNSTTGEFNIDNTTSTTTTGTNSTTTGSNSYDEAGKSKRNSNSTSLVTVVDTTSAGTNASSSRSTSSSDSGKGKYSSSVSSNTGNGTTSSTSSQYASSGNGNSSSTTVTSTRNVTGSLQNSDGSDYTGTVDQSTVDGMIDGTGNVQGSGYDSGNGVSNFSLSTSTQTIRTGTFYKYNNSSNVTDGAGTFFDDNSANTTTLATSSSAGMSTAKASPQTGITKESTSSQSKSSTTLSFGNSLSNVSGSYYADGTSASSTSTSSNISELFESSDTSDTSQVVDFANASGVTGHKSSIKSSSVEIVGSSQDYSSGYSEKYADGSSASSATSSGNSSATSTTNSSNYSEVDTVDTHKPNLTLTVNSYNYSDVTDNVKTINSAHSSSRGPLGSESWNTEYYSASGQTSFDNSETKEARKDVDNFQSRTTTSSGTGTTSEGGNSRNDSFANGTSSANSYYYSNTSGTSESTSATNKASKTSNTANGVTTSGNSTLKDIYNTNNVVSSSNTTVYSNTPVNGSETINVITSSSSSGDDDWDYSSVSNSSQTGTFVSPENPNASTNIDSSSDYSSFTDVGGGTFTSASASNTTTTTAAGGETSTGTSSSSSSSSYETTKTQDSKSGMNTTSTITGQGSSPARVIAKKTSNSHSETTEKMTTYSSSSTDSAGNTTTVSGTTAQDPDDSNGITEEPINDETSITIASGPVAEIKGNSKWDSTDFKRTELNGGSSFSESNSVVVGSSNFKALIGVETATDATGTATKSGTAFSKSSKDEKTTVTQNSKQTQKRSTWSTSNLQFMDTKVKRESIDEDHDITSGYAVLQFDTEGNEVWSGGKMTDTTDYHKKFKRTDVETPTIGNRDTFDSNGNGVNELHTKKVKNYTEEMSEETIKNKNSHTLNSTGEYESPEEQFYSPDQSTAVYIRDAYSKSGVDTETGWTELVINGDIKTMTVSKTSNDVPDSKHTYHKTQRESGEFDRKEETVTSGAKTHGELTITTTVLSTGAQYVDKTSTDTESSHSDVKTVKGVSNGSGGNTVTTTIHFEHKSNSKSSDLKSYNSPSITTQFGPSHIDYDGSNSFDVSGSSSFSSSNSTLITTESESIGKQSWDDSTQTVSVTETQTDKLHYKYDQSGTFGTSTTDGSLSVSHSHFIKREGEGNYTATATSSYTVGPGNVISSPTNSGSISATYSEKISGAGGGSGSYDFIKEELLSAEDPPVVTVKPISTTAAGVYKSNVSINFSESMPGGTGTLDTGDIEVSVLIHAATQTFSPDIEEFPEHLTFWDTFAFMPLMFINAELMTSERTYAEDFIQKIEDQGFTTFMAFDASSNYVEFAEIAAMNPSFLDGLLTELSNNWATYLFPGYSALLDLYGVSINDVINQLVNDFEDGSLFDRFTAAIDGMLDSVNPFNDLISVPDIGALFGNQDDYDAAYAIGAAGGTAIVLTASVFGPGLVQCGSWGQKALIAYEGADIAGGLATAGKSISSGNFGLSDAINIAGAVFSVGGLKNALGACFVGDTLVVVPDHLNFQPEVAGLASDPERDSEWNLSTMLLAAISVPVGLAGFGLLEKKKKKQQPFAKLDHLFAENDFHELWHPQSDVPRNSQSQYFPVNRGSETELLSNRELSFATMKEPQHQLRKQTEMHKPHLQNNVVQKQTRSRLAGGISVVGLLCLLGTFLVSGGLFWMAAPKTEQKTPVVASATVPLAHKRIQDIQPGQWVKADNPAEEDDTEFGKHVDPATWKLLKLKAPKLDGSIADVSLLRPNHWLTQQAATVGGTVYISVPECGIDGNAKVLSIEACPPIAANPGPGFQVVTGTFQHQAAKILDIAVKGESKPIGTTPNHPFWSVDRQEFVRADSLTVGERLQNLNGVTTVTKITPRGPPEPVYNLEVQVKHTYYVANSGVLVHNGKNCTSAHSKALGKNLTENVGARPAGGYQAAHIVPTNNFSKRSKSVQNAITTAQKKFDKYLGPNLRDTHINGFWAKAGHAGTHTDEFFLELGNAMRSANSREMVDKALANIWKRIEAGEFIQ